MRFEGGGGGGGVEVAVKVEGRKSFTFSHAKGEGVYSKPLSLGVQVGQ